MTLYICCCYVGCIMLFIFGTFSLWIKFRVDLREKQLQYCLCIYLTCYVYALHHNFKVVYDEMQHSVICIVVVHSISMLSLDIFWCIEWFLYKCHLCFIIWNMLITQWYLCVRAGFGHFVDKQGKTVKIPQVINIYFQSLSKHSFSYFLLFVIFLRSWYLLFNAVTIRQNRKPCRVRCQYVHWEGHVDCP